MVLSGVMSPASVRMAPSGGQTSNTEHSLETEARWDQRERECGLSRAENAGKSVLDTKDLVEIYLVNSIIYHWIVVNYLPVVS